MVLQFSFGLVPCRLHEQAAQQNGRYTKDPCIAKDDFQPLMNRAGGHPSLPLPPGASAG